MATLNDDRLKAAAGLLVVPPIMYRPGPVRWFEPIPYYERARSIAPANLIGYWPMWEESGGVSEDLSSQLNLGAYTGVTFGQPGIGDGRTCSLFDGANDFNNVYSAGLNADFNKDELTIATWAKVSGAGIWTDATERQFMLFAAASNSNGMVRLVKSATDNTIFFNREDTAAGKTISKTVSPLDWFHLALTVSVSANLTAAYYNGLLVDTAAADTWTDALASNKANIGASTTTPTGVFDGYLAHALLFNAALSAAAIAVLARV